MIRAYDDNGNVARCVECKFYNRKQLNCENYNNHYRGSGNEYTFSLDFIGAELLTAEDCDNWVCGDFELKNELEDTITIYSTGMEEGIRCAMCTNPMANDRGCDGGCRLDEDMYNKVLDVIYSNIIK